MAEEMMPKPSVNRMVHYRDTHYTEKCLAACITEVTKDEDDTPTVGLVVLYPTGAEFIRGVYERDTNGAWHWPERA